jgi:beta-galactosidase
MTAACRLVAALLLAWLIASPAAAAEVPFDAGWRFLRVDDGSAPERPPANARWTAVSLPHTSRIEPRIVNDQWQGIAFYAKSFDAPAKWRGQTVMLRVEAAMNVALVTVNGRTVASHLGGYLPFTVDLTPHLRTGARNDILIRLDNRDNPVTGPKPLKQLDFNTYGGLYRGVRLIVKPPVHLSDEMLADRVAGGGLFVTYPEANASRATVEIAADVRNAGPGAVSAEVTHLLYQGKRIVGRSTGRVSPAGGATERSVQRIVVANPALWSPRRPNLYRLVTTVVGPGGAADRTETRIGIRRIGFDGNRFVINGERMFLRGVNRHQEYPYVGYAVSPSADYRDAKRIKEAGFDYVRLSHYPQSPAFMAAADALGLVLVDSILGWQYSNPDPAFRAQVLRTCRDMIRRDRNHPSVIAWECSLNETDMPRDLIRDFHRAVHEEYPGDQSWSAGWQNLGYDIFLQARQHRLQHYEAPGRPYIVSEYGDWEYYAQNAGFNQEAWANLKEEERTSRQPLGAGEARLLQQATNVQEAHNDNLRTPAFADGYWVMYDYNRGYVDDLETSGIMSLERLPKFSWWFFRSQRGPGERSALYDSGPMVRIASYWTAESSPRIRVFSNAEEVELTLNGRSLGRRRPVRGPISDLIAHPPFEFDARRFEPGTLEAVAYVGGRRVAADRVETPEAPGSLKVSLDDAGVRPRAGDLLFARAEAHDRKGAPVPVAPFTARFRAKGDFEIVGPAEAAAEGGIASVLVRVRRSNPRGSVAAEAAGLSRGRWRGR